MPIERHVPAVVTGRRQDLGPATRKLFRGFFLEVAAVTAACGARAAHGRNDQALFFEATQRDVDGRRLHGSASALFQFEHYGGGVGLVLEAQERQHHLLLHLSQDVSSHEVLLWRSCSAARGMPMRSFLKKLETRY